MIIEKLEIKYQDIDQNCKLEIDNKNKLAFQLKDTESVIKREKNINKDLQERNKSQLV